MPGLELRGGMGAGIPWRGHRGGSSVPKHFPCVLPRQGTALGCLGRAQFSFRKKIPNLIPCGFIHWMDLVGWGFVGKATGIRNPCPDVFCTALDFGIVWHWRLFLQA